MCGDGGTAGPLGGEATINDVEGLGLPVFTNPSEEAMGGGEVTGPSMGTEKPPVRVETPFVLSEALPVV